MLDGAVDKIITAVLLLVEDCEEFRLGVDPTGIVVGGERVPVAVTHVDALVVGKGENHLLAHLVVLREYNLMGVFQTVSCILQSFIQNGVGLRIHLEGKVDLSEKSLGGNLRYAALFCGPR